MLESESSDAGQGLKHPIERKNEHTRAHVMPEIHSAVHSFRFAIVLGFSDSHLTYQCIRVLIKLLKIVRWSDLPYFYENASPNKRKGESG